MLGRVFRRVVLARHWLCFGVLCLSFALFGAGTLNLFNLLRANLGLIADNGIMALTDGAAQQLAELIATLLVSMAAYVVFKACEHSLVHGLTHIAEKDTTE
jgi:hypothetical protein